MADCELLEKCIFYNDKMKDAPATAEMFKKKYCRSDNSECARYMVFQALGREKVPPALFPNLTDEAKKILRRASFSSLPGWSQPPASLMALPLAMRIPMTVETVISIIAIPFLLYFFDHLAA
jgi:hypothetical protein